MQLKKYDEKLIKSRGKLVYTEYLKLIESGELLVGIEVTLDKLKMSLTKFISILMQYLEEFEDSNDYQIFDELLNNPNPREYLKENFIPKDYLSTNLNNYLYYRRPDILFGNKTLLKTLNSLIEYNNKLWLEREQQEKNKKEILPFIENIIKEYLNQEYSLERFCLFKNISKYYFYPKKGLYTKEIAMYNKDLYQEFLNRYTYEQQTKKKNIINDIYTLFNIIKEKGFLDAIDFYQTTIYSPLEVLEVADEILNNEDNKLIREYINRLKDSFTNNRNHKLKVGLSKDKYTFNLNGNLIETSEEDRLIILEFLEKENIPISSVLVFQDACKRYFENNLIPKVRSIKHD